MNKKKLFFIVLFFCLVCVGVFAEDAPWNDTLETVVEMLTGNTARLILAAVIAIIGIAIAAIGGQGMKEKLFFVIIGGGICFSAQTIVNWAF